MTYASPAASRKSSGSTGNSARASAVSASSVGVRGAPGCCFSVKEDKAERARWMASALGDD